MAQDPFKVDQIQVAPGSGETLLIDRDEVTDSLRFRDALIAGGLILSQLAGLRNIPNVFIVGTSGAGAQYTTIQSALDDVPSAASATNPYLILVMAGVYTETVNIVRDGVHLLGLGRVVLRSALEATPNAVGNDHTLIISAQLGTIPKTVTIENIRITNAHNNKACVRIVGGAGSTVGNGLITLRNCDLAADAAGGNRPLWATTVNNILVEGGNLGGSTADLVVLEEVAWFRAVHVRRTSALDFRWDTDENTPANVAEGYFMHGCHSVAEDTGLTPLAVALDGGGTAGFTDCTLPDVQVSGDQAVSITRCSVGDLTLLNTTEATLTGSTRGAIAANATAVLTEPRVRGTATFNAEATKAVTFDVPMADDSFVVFFELSATSSGEVPWVTGKAATGFTINFDGAQTMDVEWVAIRTDV